MVVENVFNNVIYPNLKTYLTEHLDYGVHVIDKYTQEASSILFPEPIVVVKLLPYTNTYNNLSYGEVTYSFGINVDIYAMDLEDTARETICEEIRHSTESFLENNYRLKVKITPNAPNADDNIQRDNIRATGTIDTKYGLDNLVIYPK